MKYAQLEENTNKILGWYSDDIHSDIPTPNIEVTDEIWQEAININANCYENSKFIVKDFRTDEQKEQQRIQQIESKCNQSIESVYPIYKQINITNLLTPYTEEDREVMKAFIDSKRAICHKAIADVKRPLTKNEEGEYVDDITAEEIEAGYEAVRGFLYREITDPLFFKVQRREIEESVWLDEIQKIKDENKPKIETSNES